MLFRKYQRYMLTVVLVASCIYTIVNLKYVFIQRTPGLRRSPAEITTSEIPATIATIRTPQIIQGNESPINSLKVAIYHGYRKRTIVNRVKEKHVEQNVSSYNVSEYKSYYSAFNESSINDTFTNYHTFKFSMNVENTCSGATFIITIIHTAPYNSMNRNLIRQTWGAYKSHDVIVARPVFLLGQVTNETLQNLLRKESQTHGDIIQGNFLDSYRNLTYKNMMGLHWVKQFCNQSKYVLKVDDDVIVNMNRLVTYLLLGKLYPINMADSQNTIHCSVFDRSKALRDGDWKVFLDEFPYQFYPRYCQGYAYVMTLSIVRRLYEASKTVKHFWIDDVYVTGLLAAKSGITLSPFPNGASGGTMMPTVNLREIMMNAFFVCRNKFWLNEWTRIWKLMNKKQTNVRFSFT